MREEIRENIQGSRYSVVNEDIVISLIDKESQKYKKKKDVEKSVRAKLHAWVTMFYENYNQFLKNIEEVNIDDDFLNEILKTHISTKERFAFLQEFFCDISAQVGDVEKIIDLGAGFNPIAYYLYSKNKNIEYLAYDVEKRGIELLNACFTKLKIAYKAQEKDVALNNDFEECDVVFMFKLLPLLEQQKKGSSVELVKKLKTKKLCITYPTRTLSGKNVGMYAKYKKDIEILMAECNLKMLFEKEYKNELLFILEK